MTDLSDTNNFFSKGGSLAIRNVAIKCWDPETLNLLYPVVTYFHVFSYDIFTK